MHVEMWRQAQVFSVYAPSVDRAHDTAAGLLIIGAVIACFTYAPEIIGACRRGVARMVKRWPEGKATGRQQ